MLQNQNGINTALTVTVNLAQQTDSIINTPEDKSGKKHKKKEK